MPFDVGQRIGGRYRIEGPIARGGMGTVFRAVDERLVRGVALKMMHPELSQDATEVTRFTREAAAMASLHHPGLVQVLDAGQDAGVPYLVMELVQGKTLAQILGEGGKLDPMRAADLVEQALYAISVAHGAGVVHRDLKPGNLMVVEGGREIVKVLDFGIAQLKTGHAYTRLTQTGAIVGTPTFMAPEQVRGETCDARTDVYAMGVVLWCCLTGRKPFVGKDVADTIMKVLGEPAIRADRLEARVSPALATTIEVAMSKRREERFATASAFAAALSDLRHGVTRTASTTLMPSASLPPPRVSHLPTPLPLATTPATAEFVAAPAPAISPRMLLGAIGLLGTMVVLLTCAVGGFVYREYASAPATASNNGGGISFGSAAPSRSTGDPCQRAAQCCTAMLTGMGDSADAYSCSRLADLGRYGPQAQSSCQQTYNTYRNLAAQRGIHCE